MSAGAKPDILRDAMPEEPAEQTGSGGTDAKGIAALNTLEREVLERLVAGNTQKSIAATLNIDDRIVASMYAEIMKKMNADDLAHLIRLGQEAGMRLSRPE